MLIEMWFFLVLANSPTNVIGQEMMPTPATTVGPFADEKQCYAYQARIQREQTARLTVILPCWRGQ